MSDEFLQALPAATDIGWGAVVILVVVLIIRGDLVPRKTYEDVVRQRDYWQKAARERDKALYELLEIGSLSAAAFQALPKPDAGDGEEKS